MAQDRTAFLALVTSKSGATAKQLQAALKRKFLPTTSGLRPMAKRMDCELVITKTEDGPTLYRFVDINAKKPAKPAAKKAAAPVAKKPAAKKAAAPVAVAKKSAPPAAVALKATAMRKQAAKKTTKRSRK